MSDTVLPANIGRYQVLGDLARGAFGVVVRAYDPTAACEVYLTIVDGPATGEPTGMAPTHPNIVPVTDTGRDGERSYFVTRPTDGLPLPAAVSDKLPSFSRVARWTRDLALALQHAHSAAGPHGALSPACVLIDQNKGAKLTGFGAALPTPDALLSPEEARGEPIGPLADQYRLAAIAYQLLTTRRPCEGPPDQIRSRIADASTTPKPLRDIDPSIPLALEAIVMKGLQKLSWNRYPTAADFAVELQKLLTGEKVSAVLRTSGPSRDCPTCGRSAKAVKPRCLYCNTDLVGLGNIDDEGSSQTVGTAVNPEEMKLVRLGLGFHAARLVLYLLAMLVLIGGVVVATTFGKPAAANGPSPAFAAAIGLAAILLVPQPLLAVIGSVLALTVPARSRTRPLLAASLTFEIFGLVGSCVAYALEVTETVSSADLMMVQIAGSLIPGAFAFGSWILFMLFLNRLAKFASLTVAADDALVVLKQGVGVLLAPIPIGFIAGLFIGLGIGGLGLFIAIMLVFFWLFAFARWLFAFVKLLGDLREGLKGAEPVQRKRRKR